MDNQPSMYVYDWVRIGPGQKVIKNFQAQLRLKLILLVNVKMPTIVFGDQNLKFQFI